jgi:flagellar biosynthesis protein FliR
VLIVGFPVRASISLLILIASLSGIARAAVDLVPTTIDAIVRTIGVG